MISHNERFVISFNGEIYNHLDLKKEQEKKLIRVLDGEGILIQKYY